jgi:hypothetical protein
MHRDLRVALAMGLLSVRFVRRCADYFSFRVVRYHRTVRSRVAIAAIEVCEFGGEFVTHGESVGRKVPAGVGKAAALHFQC